MASLNETVIFPDRPLFLTHRKKPGKPGTIDLSPANLNGVLASSSFRSRPKESAFQVQGQPTSAEAGKASLSRYRKIKFIDNNVADITNRRSARPRQLKSKRPPNNTESPQNVAPADPPTSGSSDSTSPERENAVAVDETIDDFVRAVVQANPAEPLESSPLTLVTPRNQHNLYTDKMSMSVRNFVPHMLGYCKTFPLSSLSSQVSSIIFCFFS